MKITKLFEDKFWIFFVLILILGLVTPPIDKIFLSIAIVPLVMSLFFFSCLKVDFLDVLAHVKKPTFLIYVLFSYLLIIPAIVYIIFRFLTPELAIGMLLLASAPPGAASPVFVDIFKGNTAMSLAITLLSYIISPFTITFLLFIFTQNSVSLDLNNILKTLILINFLPLIASQIIRKINLSLVEKTKNYYNLINILIIGFILYIAVSTQATELLHNPLNALIYILWLYLFFIILFLLAYFLGFWRSKTDKITLAVTKAFMNNMLLLGIATTFFSPQVVLLMIISEVPWGTVAGPFKFLLKHLK